MGWGPKKPKITVSDEVRDHVESENDTGGGNLFDLGTFGGTNVVGVGPGGGGSINIGSNGSMHHNTRKPKNSGAASDSDVFNTVLTNLNNMGANITPGKLSDYTPSHLSGHTEVHVFQIPNYSFTQLEGMLEEYVDDELNLTSREMDEFYRTDKRVFIAPSHQNATHDSELTSIFVVLGDLNVGDEWKYMKGMMDYHNVSYTKMPNSTVSLVYDADDEAIYTAIQFWFEDDYEANHKPGEESFSEDLAHELHLRTDMFHLDFVSSSSNLANDYATVVITYGLSTDANDLKIIEEAVKEDSYRFQLIA